MVQWTYIIASAFSRFSKNDASEMLYIYIYIYDLYDCMICMVFTTEGLFEVAIESWPELDLNPRPLNSVQML